MIDVRLWGLALLLVAGCNVQPDGRTARDDFRASCINAARWHGLATERAADGRMSAETFASIDEAYDGVVATCSRVLSGGAPPSAAEQGMVKSFAEGAPR
jgi:hypothetical protein